MTDWWSEGMRHDEHGYWFSTPDMPPEQMIEAAPRPAFTPWRWRERIRLLEPERDEGDFPGTVQ